MARCRKLWPTLLLAALVAVIIQILTSGAAAQVESSDACHAVRAQNWTEAEVWIWDQICARQFADLAVRYDYAPDPAQVESWPPESQISPEFISTILLDEPYRTARQGRAVRIGGANLVALDLQRSTIDTDFFLFHSVLEGDLDLGSSTVSGSVVVNGSRVGGELGFNAAQVAGFIFASGSVLGSADFTAASTGSNLQLDATQAQFVSFNRAEIDGTLWLSDSELGEVNAVGARVASNIEADNLKVDGLVNLSSSSVGQNVFVRRSQVGELVLSSSTIGVALELDGSTVGTANLNSSRVGVNVFIRDGARFDTIDAVAVTVGQDLDATQAAVDGSFLMSSAEIGGQLMLTDGSYGQVGIRSADVGLNVGATGVTMGGLFDLNSAHVGGSVYLRGGAKLSDVDAVNVDVGDSFDVEDSEVSGQLNLGSATIGGSLFVRSGARVAEILAVSASIGSDVQGQNASFTGLADFSFTQVSDNVLFIGSSFGELRLAGTSVAGDLDLSAAEVSGALTAPGMEVHRSLVLAGRQGPVKWDDGSQLDLRSATVNSIDDSVDSWPGVVLLNGFVYQQPEGPNSISGATFIDRDLSWYLAWLSDDKSEDTDGFFRQPYLQLEQSLRDVGRGADADRVAMARLVAEREGKSPPGKVLDWLDWLLIGYGYRPERVLVLGLVFWALGTYMVHRDRQFRRYELIHSRVMFSLDHLLPIVTFLKANDDADFRKMRRETRWYFYSHIVAGYVLGILLVAIIARVTRA